MTETQGCIPLITTSRVNASARMHTPSASAPASAPASAQTFSLTSKPEAAGISEACSHSPSWRTVKVSNTRPVYTRQPKMGSSQTGYLSSEVWGCSTRWGGCSSLMTRLWKPPDIFYEGPPPTNPPHPSPNTTPHSPPDWPTARSCRMVFLNQQHSPPDWHTAWSMQDGVSQSTEKPGKLTIRMKQVSPPPTQKEN